MSEPVESTRVQSVGDVPTFVQDAPHPSTITHLTGDAPPGFTIEKELGRGGMGVVHLATQKGLNRACALKMVLGTTDPKALIRFLAESEAIAAIRHPNVVEVYQFGEHRNQPFLAMEYCPGGSLNEKIATMPRATMEDFRAIAALMAKIAAGVNAAHEQGIVHRDMKPHNVLLSSDDEPKVTDFGLAKRGAGADLTRTSAVMGTPAYMPPEQARGDTKFVGPQADVWALGVMLYELLTGHRPFDGEDTWTILAAVQRGEFPPPRKLNAPVPRDLELIALKCLAREPHDRYTSAGGLREDLSNWLDDKPISARELSGPAKLAQWVRRNRLAAGIMAATVVALAIMAVTATWALHETDRAEANAVSAETASNNFQAAALQAQAAEKKAEREAEHARNEQKTAEKTLADLISERGQSADYRYAARINRAAAEWSSFQGLYSRQMLDACPPELRGWEWGYLKRLFDESSVVLRGHAGQLFGVESLGDTQQVATIAQDTALRIWDTQTGLEVRTIPVGAYLLTAHPNGERIAIATRDGKAIQLYEVKTGKLLKSFKSVITLGMAYSPDGRELRTLTEEGFVIVRNAESGEEIRRSTTKLDVSNLGRGLLGIGITAAFSPDGQYVAVGGEKLRVWKTTGELHFEDDSHLLGVGRPAFSPDSRRLVTPGFDNQLKVWDVATKKSALTLRGHRGRVWAAAYSRDGRQIASSSKDTTARLWSAETGQLLLTHVGHQSEVFSCCFLKDCAHYCTVCADATARVWSTDPRVTVADHVAKEMGELRIPDRIGGSAEHLTFYGHRGSVGVMVLSPDGRHAATRASGDDKVSHQITVWNLDTRKEVLRIDATRDRLHQLQFSNDGRHLIVAHNDTTRTRVVAYPLKGGPPLWSYSGAAGKYVMIQLSPQGTQLAIATRTNFGTMLTILDANTGAELNRRGLRGDQILAGFLADGSQIVLGGINATNEGVARLFATESDAIMPTREMTLTTSGFGSMRVSRSNLLAAVDPRTPSVMKLWDLNTGKLIRNLEGHAGYISGQVFSPDGSRLLTTATDFTARVWHVGTGHELLNFRDHTDVIMAADWSADNSRIATAGQDGALRVWTGPAPDRAAEAENWPVRFKDDFERKEIGPDWTCHPNENWVIENGVAKGKLADATAEIPNFNSARIILNRPTHDQSVNIRYRFRANAQMVVVCCIAHNDRLRRMLQPSLVGNCWRIGGVPAARLGFLNSPTGTLKDMNYSIIGQNGKFILEADRWYAVRILREPERLRMWVDGKAAIDERTPKFDLPRLSIDGSWGNVGDVLEIDDVEVRTP